MNKLAEQLSNDIAVRAAQKLASLISEPVEKTAVHIPSQLPSYLSEKALNQRSRGIYDAILNLMNTPAPANIKATYGSTINQAHDFLKEIAKQYTQGIKPNI